MDMRTPSEMMASLPANDNPEFAFAIGEDIEVMTRGVIIERSQSATGRTYLVCATKDDGREIFIRAGEIDIYEAEPRAQQAAA